MYVRNDNSAFEQFFTFLPKGRDTPCDKSLRHIVATSRTAAVTRLLVLTLSLRYVTRIQTSLNSRDRATADSSDKILSHRQWFSHVTRGDLLLQPVAATRRSDLSHSVSRP